MRVLYGRVFGLGNAVCAVPAIKAIAFMGHTVDVLVGNGPDDVGAYDVLNNLKGTIVRKVFKGLAIENARVSPMVYDEKPTGEIHVHVDESLPPPVIPEYDVAIMAIPFDGRWRKMKSPGDLSGDGAFWAKEVLDTRPRPEFSPTLGFSAWKKHEVEYQMDIARELGFTGETPDCSFMPIRWAENKVYLGMGYKKDAAGYWAQKHWGNENYAELVKQILKYDPDVKVVTTGDALDLKLTIWPVMRMVGPDPRLKYISGNLRQSFDVVASCKTFIGNDTGMAHVAAACGLGVVPYFKLEGASTKSHPWCQKYEVLEGARRDVTVEEFYGAFKRIHYGEAQD